MDRDDKHALFAAAALNALIAAELTKPVGQQVSAQCTVTDAAYFADLLIREVEKK